MSGGSLIEQEHPVTPHEFRKVLGNFATGVTVLTVMTPGQCCYGITVNSFTAVSLFPPLVLVCLSNTLGGLQLFEVGRAIGINVLPEHCADLSNLFAQKAVNKFQDLTMSIGPSGAPLMQDALAVIECQIDTIFPGGDHKIVVAKVQHVAVQTGDRPLIFFRGKYSQLSRENEIGGIEWLHPLQPASMF